MTGKYACYGLIIHMMTLSTLLATDGVAQYRSVKEVPVTLHIENALLAEVLQEIETKTSFTFTYEENDLTQRGGITVQASDENLDEVLLTIGKTARVHFKQINDNIHVKSAKPRVAEETVEIAPPIQVSGKVSSASDEGGLPGVNILVKGGSVGTITDASGNYSLNVPDANDTLVFSSIGYLSQEIPINGQSTINVELSEDIQSLGEVVVIGYGTQKKSNVSGSIVSIGSEDIAKVQAPTFDAALQGRVPGVYVTTNGGQPGGGVFVRIRGTGSINNSNPLYVIDGVVVGAGDNENSNPLATINPNDIETIDILKDAASTAIYGARAANGVVLITTKRGKAGKPRVSYNAYAGIQEPVSQLPRPLNAQEFAENMNTAFAAAGEEPPFPNPASLGEGVNYLDEVISNGFITDHQLAVSGGTESNQYYVSLNYFDNQGIMLETFQKRFSIRANTDNQITKAIKIGNSLMYSRGSRFDNGAGNRTFIHGTFTRSEERRVGKECRSRWSPYH